MRLKELFDPIVSEAISVSQYDTVIESALEQAIQNLLVGRWMTARLQLPTIMLSRQFDGMKFLDDELITELGNECRKSLMKTLNPLLKKDYPQLLGPNSVHVIEWIHFEDMTENGYSGYANGYIIALSTRYLKSFAEELKEELWRYIHDNGLIYNVDADDPDLAPHQQEHYKLYYKVDAVEIIKLLSRRNKEVAQRVMDKLGSRSGVIRDMISTITHEVVHVLQHRAQRNRTDGKGTEYRSYLDTRKGEFRSLAGKRAASASDVDEKQWDRLYYASPQEIGAYAHNIALRIIRDLGFNEPGADLSIRLTAQDFVDALRWRIGDQYRDPNNPKEQAILKRYLKLAYQEVLRYIEKKKQAEKSEPPLQPQV